MLTGIKASVQESISNPQSTYDTFNISMNNVLRNSTPYKSWLVLASASSLFRELRAQLRAMELNHAAPRDDCNETIGSVWVLTHAQGEQELGFDYEGWNYEALAETQHLNHVSLESWQPQEKLFSPMWW